ncbi:MULTISPECIES: hypothetical protein [Burkholderia]|uniref:hypothetical protein n=1 Tax=Burkholderia TaxID=32008 RepID=UPI0027E3D78A|nr:hypothetical protein [Burkholderia sp. MSMB175]
MTQIAGDAGSGRESLYKALDEHGDPDFATIPRVVRALGLTLTVTPAHTGTPDVTSPRFLRCAAGWRAVVAATARQAATNALSSLRKTQTNRNNPASAYPALRWIAPMTTPTHLQPQSLSAWSVHFSWFCRNKDGELEAASGPTRLMKPGNRIAVLRTNESPWGNSSVPWRPCAWSQCHPR